MKINEFNIKKGIYDFELDEVNTQFHAHPAVEILLSPDGKLEIETEDSIYTNIVFAVIKANVRHKVTSDNGTIHLMMVECNASFLNELLERFGVEFKKEIFTEKIKTDKTNLLNHLSQIYAKHKVDKTLEPRIEKCFEYLDSKTADYKEMMQVLKSEVNLSESRLSHIFKEEVGISLKKYLVWSRLKKAFQFVVTEEINMYEASLKSGFFDQAHLSKAFKQMLGLNPSEVF